MRRNQLDGRSKGMRPSQFDQAALRRGMLVEMEHTTDPKTAQRIAMDHLAEDPRYYEKLARVHNPARRRSSLEAPKSGPQVKGIRAQKVISHLEKSEMKVPPIPMMSAAHLVHYALHEYIGLRATETFLAVYINVHNIVVGFTEYSSGSTSDVAVNPSGIFRDALLANAAGMITVHQHPSGSARPSDADELLWGRLKAIGEIMGIPVIDNLVLGEDEFYSESENRMTKYARLRLMLP